MKKILFVINNMHLGGTRKSLLSLLNELSNIKDLQVDLMILSHNGPLMKEIPDKINVLRKSEILEMATCNKYELTSITSKLFRAIIAFLHRIIGYDRVYPYIYKFAIKRRVKLVYDASIGFQEGISNDLAFYINAKKHYAWIHNDFDNFKHSKSDSGIERLYPLFDKVLFVAEASRKNFIKNHPLLENKCEVIKNTINSRVLLEKAEEPTKSYFKTNYIRFVTVGRVSEQKGYDRIINIANKMKDKNLKFEWVVIGDGPKLEELIKSVKDNNLEEYLRFVGGKTNPYKIERQADLYVMTSRYESQPLVLIESAILGLPIVTTNFDSAYEVVGSLKSAHICSNNEDSIRKFLEDIIIKHDILEKMKKEAGRYEYDNHEIVERLLSLC
ncbi:glycosyltransferase [Clostridium perfringens]|uniref:glycosyltransferase n=1 Tax=Clostridium perfringens TaxID=1502 RepID=UPI002A5EC9E9|nr:glycosyltransferase [Clostridium perfringens]MDJ8932651.1 glycosyltransferase [Clostridium perfringens]MDJ8938525.1 glycosyltransferase [Clostridium perfringens]MDJ8941498.1 glycosyltransferase [Clostridium perfringens]